MSGIPKELAELARRIDDGERRVEHVRALIARCEREGKHSGRARELLAITLERPQPLYAARATARRHGWLRPLEQHAPNQRLTLTFTPLLAGARWLADGLSLDPFSIKLR